MPPAKFLAVNSHSIMICFGDFCFVMKMIEFRSTCLIREHRPPQFKFNSLFNKHFAKLIFFVKSLFSHKKSSEVDCDLKLTQ